MKGALARLGIRNFRPTLRNAAEHLAGLYTPEGSPLPPNVAAELERDIARLGLVIGQIKQIEEARRQRLEEQPEAGRTPWFDCWFGLSASALKRQICSSMRCCRGPCVTVFEPFAAIAQIVVQCGRRLPVPAIGMGVAPPGARLSHRGTPARHRRVRRRSRSTAPWRDPTGALPCRSCPPT